MLSLSFHAFEHCIRDLLTRLGYSEVRLLGRTEWRQPTKHGGLDMEAVSTTGITQARIALQLKQYRDRPVSRRFVDELRGTMSRTGATHGLILTTSTFSKAAKRAAQNAPRSPIRLVDGEELLHLLQQYGVGTYMADDKNGRIDSSYFHSLESRYPSRSSNSSSKALESARFRNTVANASIPNLSGGSMLWRTHALGGVASLFLLQALPGGTAGANFGVLATVAVLGALLPDLDSVQSKIKSLRIGEIRPFAPLANLLHASYGHRGALHSLTGLSIFGVLVFPFAIVIGWQIPLSLWLGYASHLALDACTRSGIPLWSKSVDRVHLLPEKLRFVTGSMEEEALFALLGVVVILLLLRYLPLTSQL
ncbi:MAG: restriction endonuclease [Armatimonadetes bacterium]|nr:restriction endonuclease [Armatimonadota bacterium]